MTRLPSLTGLEAFEAAARHQSFRDASQELSVTPTAVSHRIRNLEADLGVELFLRTPRQVHLSDAGRTLMADVGIAFDHLRRAAEKISRPNRRKVLTLSTVASFAVKWLVPRLGGFQRLHPDVDVRVSTSMNLVNFRHDGIDVAIRYGRGDWPGLQADKLITEDWRPVCSPQLLRSQSVLEDPQDLAHHTLLHISAYPDDWERWLTMAGVAKLEPRSNLFFDDTATAVAAAIDGLGVALGRQAFVESDLQAGRLIEPFDIHLPQETAFYVVTPQSGRPRTEVAAFRRWLIDESRRSQG